MTRFPLRALAIALTVAVVAPACVIKEGRSAIEGGVDRGAIDARMADLPPGLSTLAFDPAPETLLEPPPLTKALQVLAKNKRVLAFCVGLETLDGIPEPDPNDLDAVYSFATRYYGTTSTMQLTVELPEDAQGNRRRIPLPREVASAILEEQAQMWAYLTRIVIARGGRSQVQVGNDRFVQSMVETAFIRLVNSPFTRAERILAGVRTRYCA